MPIQHMQTQSALILTCFANPSIELFVEGALVGNDTSKINEFLHNLLFCSIDADGWMDGFELITNNITSELKDKNVVIANLSYLVHNYIFSYDFIYVKKPYKHNVLKC